jgi:tetratricopeptide (TPR) repeat protein/tRNA A-37 threonylcarbamoyl transferase component Bud32
MLKMYETFQGGRYKVLKRLGEGGMGAVYEAEDTQLNRTVAIKVVRSQELDEDSLTRFKREGETMTVLSHPNIVSVLDTGVEWETHFIVMEFIAGQSLQDFMASQPDRRIAMPLALNITSQITQALKHAHSLGILHRDIKPANIMIATDQQAKLADFGIAKTLGLATLTQTGDVVGTAAYMAPEQALGEGADARSDLYSLGCVLFEMVAGQRPFPGDNAARLIFNHINDLPSLPRRVAVEIWPTLEEIIFKLLAKDPNQRYQSPDELLEAIDHAEAQADPKVVAVQAAERRWGQVLVGRDDELALLRKRCDAILQGEGSLVFLSGEAGIGKSRLAHQLAVYAEMRSARFYTGRARHHKERIPYQPWIDVMRGALHLTSPDALTKLVEDSAQDLVKLVPELAERLGEVPEAPPIPPAQQRDRLFSAIIRIMVNLSRDTPLVLLLDDLQWVDETSLQLLNYMAQKIPSERILIIGAYREDELDSQSFLAQSVAEMNRERVSETLPIKRLNADQTSEKIRKTFGGQELPKLEVLAYEKTEGNPLFIEELLRSLLAEEYVELVEGAWQVKDLSQVQVPSGIRAVVQDRLAHLSEESRDVLTVAAVIGREFNFATFQAVVEMDEESLVELIDEALQAQILIERRIPGKEVYAFRDAPVKDVLYEGISTVRRIRHHRKIGETIERIRADELDGYVEALAHHFLEGNDPSKAVDYIVRAGDKAADVFAWQEVKERYETALELMGTEEIAQRALLLQKLASVTGSMLLDPDMSLSYAEAALELYEQLDDKRKVMDVHMKIQMLYLGGFWDGAREDEALKHLEAAAAISEQFPESMEQGLMFQRMAHIHLHRGEPAKTLLLAQKAADLFAKLGTPMGTSLGTALAYTGNIDEGVAYSLGNWEAVRKLNNPLITAIFGHELTLTLALARDIRRAREWGEKVLAKVLEAGIIFEAFLRRPLALIYVLSGEVDKATETCEAEEEIEQKTLAGCYFEDVAGIGLHNMRQGERKKARAYLEQAIAAHQERNTVAAVGGCSFALGCLDMEEGNYAQAEELLLRSLDICHNGGNVLFELWVLPVLAEMYLNLGQIEKTAEYVERGTELLAPDRNWYGLPAPLHTVKGMLASAQKKWEEAEEAFNQAVTINHQYELAWDEAKALYEWGIMFGQKRDKESAYEKLDKALVLFRSVGAKNDIEKTEAAKERLGGSWISRIRDQLK